jgi:hypothetical protein
VTTGSAALTSVVDSRLPSDFFLLKTANVKEPSLATPQTRLSCRDRAGTGRWTRPP